MAKLVSGVLVVCLMALPWTHAGNNEGVDKEPSRQSRRHSGLHKDKGQRPPYAQSCPTTSPQQRECHNSSRTNTSGVLDPKTFNGGLPKSTDDSATLPPSLLGGSATLPPSLLGGSATLPPSLLGGDHHLPKDRARPSSPNATPPWLEVDPGNPAVGYAAGVLSTRLIPAAYVLAMALGIPSNLYILLFLRSRTSRSSRTKNLSSTTVLYLSLALSDLLLLCSLGLRVHYHLNHNDWVFGEAACRLATASFYWNVSCSAHTIACVSVSRYLAVARPFLYRRLPKTALAAGACLAVWLLFGAAVVPELLVRQSYRIPRLGGITTCHDVLPLRDSPQHALLVPYRLVLVCVGVTLPFVACVLSQGAMVYHLSTTAGGRRHWAPFVRVSSLVFLIFLLCFAPAAALHAAHYARLAAARDHRLYRYYRGVVCLCCVHACLDPFLCLLMSKTTASKLTFKSLRRKSLQAQAAVV